jgi:lysophospholipase L1-like esterase
MVRRSALALIVIVLGGPVAATAQQVPTQTTPAPVPFTLDASAGEPGWIAFTATGTTGAQVQITETVGTAEPTVAGFVLPAQTGGRHHGTPWRCDRRRRTFVATETLPDDGGTQTARATVITPSCGAGLAISTWPRPARSGRPLDVTVTSTREADRRGLKVCAVRRTKRVCRSATLSARTHSASAKLVLRGSGTWTLTATGPGISLNRRLTTSRRPLTVLATGDSEIQVLDDQLASALSGRARVISEAHISTGLSKLGTFNWLTRATVQAQAIHPDVTVMSIGANDGFDLAGPGGTAVSCCGQDWIDAYAARAHQMMSAYERNGSGRVYWFLLPTPRRANFVRVYQAVDAGFLKAAAEFPSDVHVVDIRSIFSPGGTFRQFVGSVNAREPDGIHLSAGGDRIALRYLLGRMRADGTL